MTKFSFNQAVPFEATHVGEVIKDELAARNMKQSELSELTGIQKSILNDVIKGKRSLTPEMALLLENALGISAEFLMNIQTQYELDCAKQSERVVLQTKMLEIWTVLKEQVSTQFFRKVSIIKGNIIEDVKRIFEVFAVDNLDEFFGLKAKEMELSYYYRKSEKVTTNPVDIFSWKYYCYYLSRQDESSLGVFDKSSADTLTKELNKVFMENSDTVKKTGEVLNRYGIRFLVVKKVGQTPVDGMSFWIGDNPTIVVTERIASIDNFAFTTLHEVGHVYNHLTKDGKAMINLLDEKKDSEEYEADNFALNAVVPNADWKKFLAKTRDVVPYKIAPYIKSEAEKYEVNPQILFGRYKHDIGIYKIKNYFESKIL
jgi:HTH-type transcriptional regulator / antitoxin HigA